MFNLFGKICYNNNSFKGGYSVLIVLVIVGLIAVAISSSLLLLGIDFSKTSLASYRSYQARHLASACAEAALQEISNSVPFSGYGSLNIAGNSCGYLVINNGGQSRTVQASSTIANIVKKVRVNVTRLRPRITISSWQEVADF